MKLCCKPKPKNPFPIGIFLLMYFLPALPDGVGDDSNRYVNLDTDSYLGEVRCEVELSGDPIFTEGPAVDREGRVFFTNIRKRDLHLGALDATPVGVHSGVTGNERAAFHAEGQSDCLSRWGRSADPI